MSTEIKSADPAAKSGCDLHTSSALDSDGSLDIFRRSTNRCPIIPEPMPAQQPSTQPEHRDHEESYLCDEERRNLLSCAGREEVPRKGTKTHYFQEVSHCIRGSFSVVTLQPGSRILIAHAGFKIEVPARPPWPKTDIVAQYCCRYFYPDVSVT